MKLKERQLVWISECQNDWWELQKALMAAPALGLSDVTKPLNYLYMGHNSIFFSFFSKNKPREPALFAHSPY